MHWAEPYIGREYVQKEYDCASLVLDVEREVFNRVVPDYGDRPALRSEEMDLLQQGREDLTNRTESPREGDAVQMNNKGKLFHVGVYCIVNGAPSVLHNIKKMGTIITRITELPRLGLSLEGVLPMEMTAPADLLPVASWHPNALDPKEGRALSYEPFLPEETLGEYLDRLAWDDAIDLPSKAYLNGALIPREQWLEVMPQPGQRLSVHAYAEGGDSDIGRVVATLALVVLAYYAPGLAGFEAGTWQAAAVSSAVMIGGSLAINSLFPLQQRQVDNPTAASTYTLTGGSNSMRPFEPLPLIVGLHRVYPDIDEKPFTYYVGEDMFLHQTFNFGIGDLSISSQKIGETNVADLTVTELKQGSTNISNVDTEPGNELKYSTGWVQRTSPLDTVEIALDLTGVLCSYDSAGAVTNLSSSFQAQYAPAGSGTWTTIDPGPIQIGYTPDVIETAPYGTGSPPAGTGWELVADNNESG